MAEIRISDKISYIEATEEPLSADIGIIREDGVTWLYDVGDGESITDIDGSCNVVLSHFHQDHIGNIEKVRAQELFVSKETFAHTHKGTVITESIHIGNLHIFPLPSSHAKGSLGLEVDGTYAFVGDGLYCRSKDGNYVYNVQLLKEEINVLKNLKAPYLLASHFPGMIRKKEDVIAELEAIYATRTGNDPFIKLD